MNTARQVMSSIFIKGHALLILILILHATKTEALEFAEDEPEFDYGEYSVKGPSQWGYLRPEWAACKDGKQQSPINFSNRKVELVPKSEELKTLYKPSNATLINRGYDISLQWAGDDAGSIQINGTDYTLREAHWHSPSEHTINGKRYGLERHMVHTNEKTNKVAVIGVLYKIGIVPDPFLSKLMRNLSSMVKTNVKETNPGVIDPNDSISGDKFFYRYDGSLTTPPCTEGVIWTVNKKIRTVSKDQVMLLQKAVDDYARENARPLQPVNRRVVHLYTRKIEIDWTNILSLASMEANRFLGIN